MPKSRGRKPKRRPTPTPRRRPNNPGGGFDPGQLALSDDKLVKLLERAPGETLPMLFPPMLWVKLAEGNQANVCADACATLREAYAQFGITAQLTPVGVSIDRPGEHSEVHATTRPRWEPGTFIGHCVLLLPDQGRIVDPTIEQFHPVRRLGLGPLIGLVPPTSAATLRAGTSILSVPRGDLLINYLPVDPDCIDVLEQASTVVTNADAHRRTGINLATLTLAAFRFPPVLGRIRSAPFPRLQSLLDAIGDAPIEPDAAGDMLIHLNDGTAVRLDELELATGSGLVTT